MAMFDDLMEAALDDVDHYHLDVIDIVSLQSVRHEQQEEGVAAVEVPSEQKEVMVVWYGIVAVVVIS